MKLPARAQRVDRPTPGALSIELFREGEKAYLVVAPMLSPAIELRSSRPRGEPAAGLVLQLRKLLVGANLVRVRLAQGLVALDFDKGEAFTLLGDRRGEFALLRGGRTILGSRAIVDVEDAAPALDLAAFRADGETSLVDARKKADLDEKRRALLRAVQRERARLERKKRAIEGDLARVAEAARLRREAETLLLHRHAIERGATTVTLVAADGAEMTIALDPKFRPGEAIESRFKRAKRLERGAGIAEERLAMVERELAEIAETRARIERADVETLDAMATEWLREPATKTPGRRGEPSAPRVPYRRFRSRDGIEILVGRSAADNDTLTLHVAKPSDLFFHARGVTGSHVIVRRDRPEISVETLLDAATLAVHFSAAAKEPAAEVQYTERRYVRKGKGLPRGAVRLERERVVLLQMQKERLQRLLDTGERPSSR